MSKYRNKKSYRTVKKKHPLRFLKSKIFWVILLILIIIGGLVYLFIFSSVFEIKNISIFGNEKCPYEEIKEIVSARIGNVFLTNFKGIDYELKKKYPQIDNVRVKRKLPNNIIIEVEERKAVATICKPTIISNLKIFGKKTTNSICFNIDKKGVIFEEPQEDSDLPIIKLRNSGYFFNLGQKIIEKDYLEKILSINSNLNNISILETYPISKNRINIITNENWEVYFNPKEDIGWQIEKLSILLKEKLPFEQRSNLEYIDLRFEKIYLKRIETLSENPAEK